MENYLEFVYAELMNPDYAAINLRDKLKGCSEDTKFFINIEIKCFELRLDDGDLEPVFLAGDFKQTDIDLLTPEEIQYIKERLGSEDNMFLRARYAHILFKKTRDNRYALQAIPAYHGLASEYFKLLPTKEKNIIDFFDMVEAYGTISTIVKYEVEECRNQITKWYEKPYQHAFYYQCFLKFITQSKLFKPIHLKGFTEKALNYIPQVNDCYDVEDLLEACLALARKELANQQPVYLLMAENQIKLSNGENQDAAGLIKADCYLKASECYKKAKALDKANEVLRLLQEHKKNIKLTSILVRSEISRTDDAITNIAEYMLNSQPKTVFIALAIDQRLLPDISTFKPDRDGAFLNGIRVSSFDINGNTQVLSDFEKKRRDIFMDVQFRIELLIPFIIKELVKQMEKLDRGFVAEGLDYFSHTWFQNELAKTALSDKLTYRWMTTLQPALQILLNINRERKENLLTPEEQMAFDQLAIKFEGLLRDLCEMAGLTTIKVREEQTVNKDINDLLQSTELQDKFQKKDLDFWLYTFTGCGYNIRNNVAHAFYRDHDYTVTLSNILLVSYVRLAKYNDIVRQAMNRNHSKTDLSSEE